MANNLGKVFNEISVSHSNGNEYDEWVSLRGRYDRFVVIDGVFLQFLMFRSLQSLYL